jgi:hypothetical protein
MKMYMLHAFKCSFVQITGRSPPISVVRFKDPVITIRYSFVK